MAVETLVPASTVPVAASVSPKKAATKKPKAAAGAKKAKAVPASHPQYVEMISKAIQVYILRVICIE